MAAARRELVLELLRARYSDLPLMLDWKCYGFKSSFAMLQLAPGQGALKFVPDKHAGSPKMIELERDFDSDNYPKFCVGKLELRPINMRLVASVEPWAASETAVEVRPRGRSSMMHPRMLGSSKVF